MAAPSGAPVRVNVRVWPSGSVAVAVKDKSCSSLTFWLPMGSRIGAWFTLLTVITTSSESLPVPSVTAKVTVALPASENPGVPENVPVAASKDAQAGMLVAE